MQRGVSDNVLPSHATLRYSRKVILSVDMFAVVVRSLVMVVGKARRGPGRLLPPYISSAASVGTVARSLAGWLAGSLPCRRC